MKLLWKRKDLCLLGRQLLYLNISECALYVDLFPLYIGTILYHVSDVFNKVVLDNVIRKIKGDTQFFPYLFTFEVSILLVTVHAPKLPM